MRDMIVIRRLVLMAGVVVMACCCLSLTACNTVEGAGKDIEGLGDAVQDAADGD